MKKLMLLAAGIVASVFLFAGCASTGAVQSPAQVLAALQVQKAKACTVAQATLASVVAADVTLPQDQQDVIAKVSAGVKGFCSSAVAFTSVQDFVQTALPEAVKLVSASSLDRDKKNTVNIALIAFSAALSSALAQYTPVAPVAASSPSA